MSLIGERLPDPYYERVVHKVVTTHVRNRQCVTCSYQFPTVEIPLAWDWDGEDPIFCPKHPKIRSTVVTEATMDQARQGRYSSGGLLRVITFGGVYRRRECSLNFGKREGDRRSKKLPEPGCVVKGKPTRWTTAELASTGMIVADVTRCPRCGGKSHVQRGKYYPKPRGESQRQGGTT